MEFHCVPVKDRLSAVQNGSVKLGLFALSKLSERCIDVTQTANANGDKILCSDPYMLDGLGILAKAGSLINGLCDINGRTVAVVDGTSAQSGLENEIRSFCGFSNVPTWVPFPNREEAIQNMLIAEGADAYITNFEILHALQGRYPGSRLIDGAFAPEEKIVIGIAPNNQSLLDLVNETIAWMKENGRLADLMKEAGLYCVTSPSALGELCSLEPITQETQYKVKAGDILSAIALNAYGSSELWPCIKMHNTIEDERQLQSGDDIKLPDIKTCQALISGNN